MKNIMLCLIVVLFGSAMIYAQDNKEVFVNEKYFQIMNILLPQEDIQILC